LPGEGLGFADGFESGLKDRLFTTRTNLQQGAIAHCGYDAEDRKLSRLRADPTKTGWIRSKAILKRNRFC